jgi:hypothetical protein
VLFTANRSGEYNTDVPSILNTSQEEERYSPGDAVIDASVGIVILIPAIPLALAIGGFMFIEPWLDQCLGMSTHRCGASLEIGKRMEGMKLHCGDEIGDHDGRVFLQQLCHSGCHACIH